MVRQLSALILMTAALLALAPAAGPTDDELRKKPITTDTGEVGKLLQKWWKEGTAAGNVGDWYDNRDGDHSPLDLAPWPQLRRVGYSPRDVRAHRHWAIQARTLPHVVFGNSSTSAPPEAGGSNPRTYYCSTEGLHVLASHYTHNNVYIYPEHRDHDPGHNGVGDGYGDLYPTNTPYLIVSQGSSGSDQPFMRAIPFTLAAFRPEVKKKLVETGLLTSTLQMILRRTSKRLAGAGDYFTGKAHPSVFEGEWVDPLAMIKLAHDIRLDSIPPLVRLKVIEETKTTPGVDFFEPAGAGEQLADTVSVIARLWRGRDYRRRMVVSAEGSLDVNGRPLTFTWALLRGDEKRVRITPRNGAGSVAEIEVSYHERRPIAPGSPLDSSGVDVGVFAHNGAHPSAPAFVTWCSLDCEARTYDDGRPVEIGYGMGETELKVTDPAALLSALAADGVAARVFRLSADQRGALRKCAAELAPLQAAAAKARKERQEAEKLRNEGAERVRKREAELAELRKKKKDDDELHRAEIAVKVLRERLKQFEPDLQAAIKAVAAAEAKVNGLLDARQAALQASPRAFALEALRNAARSPGLWNGHAAALLAEYDRPASAPRRGAIDAARRMLLDLGIARDGPNRSLVLLPARRGAGAAEDRLTAYEKAMLEHFHAVVLAELVVPGGVAAVFHPNFVDRRLTAPKPWRDVYRHEGGRLVGWTRYSGGKTFHFTADGLLVIGTDERGRPSRARTVIYAQDAPIGRGWRRPRPLRQLPGEEVVTFAYDGAERREASRVQVLSSRWLHRPAQVDLPQER
jgi:hypothetical protein